MFTFKRKTVFEALGIDNDDEHKYEKLCDLMMDDERFEFRIWNAEIVNDECVQERLNHTAQSLDEQFLKLYEKGMCPLQYNSFAKAMKRAGACHVTPRDWAGAAAVAFSRSIQNEPCMFLDKQILDSFEGYLSFEYPRYAKDIGIWKDFHDEEEPEEVVI